MYKCGFATISAEVVDVNSELTVRLREAADFSKTCYASGCETLVARAHGLGDGAILLRAVVVIADKSASVTGIQITARTSRET